MRTRKIMAIAALAAAGVTLVGCSSSGGNQTAGSKPAKTAAATVATATTTATADPAPATTSASPTPKPRPKRTKDCGPGRDVFVWMVVPGVPAMAQTLGDYSNCGQKPTFDMIRSTSPTSPGTCTEAAWASDNPGYDPDAEPAERLEKVQVSVGPAC